MLLFSPRWLFLVPGLALAALSLAAFLRLMLGPVTLGGVTFDVNTLILASAGLVAGVQTVLLGMLAKASAAELGIVPPSPLLTRLQQLRPVELGIVCGVGAPAAAASSTCCGRSSAGARRGSASWQPATASGSWCRR